ncbi:MAG: hypothetical protein IPL39_13330 [Opitutaceae bacterium]|nr:hypothetical protein [Opitutaceae bacterium]
MPSPSTAEGVSLASAPTTRSSCPAKRPPPTRSATRTPHTLLDALEKSGAPDANLLLVSDDASTGEPNFTRHLPTKLGYEIPVSGITTRPGQPLIVARCGAAETFGPRRDPTAHYIGIRVFVPTSPDKFV